MGLFWVFQKLQKQKTTLGLSDIGSAKNRNLRLAWAKTFTRLQEVVVIVVFVAIIISIIIFIIKKLPFAAWLLTREILKENKGKIRQFSRLIFFFYWRHKGKISWNDFLQFMLTQRLLKDSQAGQSWIQNPICEMPEKVKNITVHHFWTFISIWKQQYLSSPRLSVSFTAQQIL